MPTQPTPTKEKLIQRVVDANDLTAKYAQRDDLTNQLQVLNNEIIETQNLQQEQIKRINNYFEAQATLQAGLDDLEVAS